MDDELLLIGRFAQLSGLSAGTLRHYDEVGLRYDVVRRTEDTDHSAFMFGSYGQADFFLLVLLGDKDRLDYPGVPSTFGLTVDDLDAYHARALAAGATEAVPPHDPAGMPRCSAVRDPSGNWIWLYQD